MIPSPDLATGGQPSAPSARAALIHRRRVVALVVLGLLFAAALVIPLVVFGGGESAAEQTTPLTTNTPPTTAERPATTTTTQSTTTTAKPPLRLALRGNESLGHGDRGSEVVTLQKALVALGFSAGEPDGVFGRVTQAAVVDFQQSNNLNPDGVVGSDTARLLNTALAKKGVAE